MDLNINKEDIKQLILSHILLKGISIKEIIDAFLKCGVGEYNIGLFIQELLKKNENASEVFIKNMNKK